jgi:hypothetical protein
MMHISVVPLLFCLVFILGSPQPGYTSGVLLDDYKSGLSPKWEEKSFKGKTFYQ